MTGREESEIRQRELVAQIQHRLLEKLAETGAQYRGMIESLREVVLCADITGKLLFLNMAWSQILGHDVAESIGKNIAEFVVPADGARMLKLVTALEADEEFQFGEVYSLVSASGQIKRLLVAGRGRRGAHAIAIFRDVTDDERIRGELSAATVALREQGELLAEQRRHTSLTLEGVSDGIILVDKKDRVYFANLAARGMLGLDNYGQDHGGTQLSDVLAGAGLQETLLLCGGRASGLVDRDWVLGNDGAVVLNVKTTRTLDEEGGVAGHVITLRDVTREREMDRMKSDFVASCSHELRTPLTSIMGFSQRLVSNPGLSTEQRTQCLGIILEQSERLKSLIDGLLDLSRIDSGEFGIKPKIVKVGDMLVGCLQAVETFGLSAGVKVGLEVNIMQTTAVLDEKLTALAVDNLLRNAIKFSQPGQSVLLSVSRKGGELLLAVRDEGMGIAKEHLERIFDRFYRVPMPDKEIPGTGFGLAIVREVAERHGGYVGVQSKPEYGSTFTLHLRA
ncbi:MAG: PAS domain S-box protein [Planctomycetes bacterium]|nr:PAS domain S-box protein [Planctomycetota bacterium]